MTKERYIVHIDMDAFFAAVEQRDDPSLKGKPVIIGSDPKGGRGRGVVSTCSYEARKYGIHSAMPISTAYKKCPHGKFITPNMGKYAEASDKILDILTTFTPEIEPISIDEAFLDITGSAHLFGGPVETCRKIRRKIKKETQLTSSIGMAPNMMTAKIASDIKKPNGLVIVTREDLKKFLHGLPVGRLWGIGAKTRTSLANIGIKTIGDLARKKSKTLTYFFGKHGQHLWELANGIDPRTVEWNTNVGSISNEHTFETDTDNKNKIMDTIMYLSEKVSRRLRKEGLKGKTITLKIRFSDFKTFTRAITIDYPTNFVDIIYMNSMSRLEEFFTKDKRSVRLLGVKVSNFSINEPEIDLFLNDPISEKKQENLHKALDKIKDKFGENAIRLRNP